MKRYDKLTERQLRAMCDAIRLLGMRGEKRRHHGPFVKIVDRYARRINATRYERIMDAVEGD